MTFLTGKLITGKKREILSDAAGLSAETKCGSLEEERGRLDSKKELNIRREGKNGKIEAREKVQGRKE